MSIRIDRNADGVPPDFQNDGYAIAFDLSTTKLKTNCGDPCNNAYAKIRRFLQKYHNFNWRQGSVYFGQGATEYSARMAIFDMATSLLWFAPSVADIRILRIEKSNDPMPVMRRLKL